MDAPFSLRWIRSQISLAKGTDIPATIERVASDASLSAENFWLLGCSAMLASIGLDVGSAAVIIGAMLISPLMGPILGTGMSLGIADRALLQRSLRSLGLATVVTLVVSTCYFLISPLGTPTAEMLSRTRPTLLDVGVAFFGGIAGIVASSRKRTTLALPGAAIATALMPPLCTAGFGLATGNWAFFLGAFYLYTLNAIFIGLATLLMVRLLRFPPHRELTEAARRRERRWVSTVAIIAIIPSIYFLYEAVNAERERQRITGFVAHRIEGPGRTVPQWEYAPNGHRDTVRVYVAGHSVDKATGDSLQALLPSSGLGNLVMQFIQSDISAEDLQRVQTDVQRDILRAVSKAMGAHDSAQSANSHQDSLRIAAAASELVQGFPEIVGVTFASRSDLIATDSSATAPAFILQFAKGIPQGQRRDILARSQALLRVRLLLPRLIATER